MSAGNLELQNIPQKRSSPTATLIFLHGLGKTGIWQKEQFQSLMAERSQFPHINIIFPTAPYRSGKYSDQETYKWFSTKITKEDQKLLIATEEVEDTLIYVDRLVNKTVDSGIPRNRIIVGGVSQGGVVALLYGYHKQASKVKGIISLSAFYPKLYMDSFRQDTQNYPELFHVHFNQDPVIPYDLSREGYNFFKSKNVPYEEHTLSFKEHSINEDMLHLTYAWILKMVPEEDANIG
uniref:palmitoyl-protein hydrolase n=2 Tax=Rhodnius prolixus TaxID=13249 RepID=R4G3G9_RHOPR